eukprot:TRINITY_DN195026_c0_g1_i2.p1 TRINITY_DN195026_c0_g1~~TRINITY_DN195026_c0_g1_i2.p1  ORF type:complete len:628 (+),score=183.52 TRINITY_DN195026_c0_g1_i2:170-1885(+)
MLKDTIAELVKKLEVQTRLNSQIAQEFKNQRKKTEEQERFNKKTQNEMEIHSQINTELFQKMQQQSRAVSLMRQQVDKMPSEESYEEIEMRLKALSIVKDDLDSLKEDYNKMKIEVKRNTSASGKVLLGDYSNRWAECNTSKDQKLLILDAIENEADCQVIEAMRDISFEETKTEILLEQCKWYLLLHKLPQNIEKVKSEPNLNNFSSNNLKIFEELHQTKVLKAALLEFIHLEVLDMLLKKVSTAVHRKLAKEITAFQDFQNASNLEVEAKMKKGQAIVVLKSVTSGIWDELLEGMVKIGKLEQMFSEDKILIENLLLIRALMSNDSQLIERSKTILGEPIVEAIEEFYLFEYLSELTSALESKNIPGLGRVLHKILKAGGTVIALLAIFRMKDFLDKVRSWRNKSGWNALMFAVKSRASLEVVHALLLGASGDYHMEQHRDGWTPLMLAARYNTVEVVKTLLLNTSHEYQMAQKKDGVTALMLAVIGKAEVDEVRALLDAAPFEYRMMQDQDGWTALMYAAFYNASVDVVKSLIENATDEYLLMQNMSGKTAAQMASAKKNTDVVQVLI